MGYYTDYEIDFGGVAMDEVLEAARTVFDNNNNPHIEFLEPQQFLYFHGGEEVNLCWYQYADNLVAMSKLEVFKDVLITVKGHGEQGLCDLWVHYFKNGQHQKKMAKVSYPKLKENNWE